jgi:MFS family permease
VFGAAALAQIALSRAATSRQFRIGLTALTLGLALVTTSVWLPSLMLFLLGGAGAGAAFKGSISIVIAIAPAARRGETLAGVFLAAYFGIAVPVLGLGLATQYVSAQTAVLGFAAALVAVAAVASRKLAAGHGGPPGRRNPRQAEASPGARHSGEHRRTPTAPYTKLAAKSSIKNLP